MAHQVWCVGGPQLFPLQLPEVDGLEEVVLRDVPVQGVAHAQPLSRVLLQQLRTRINQ